MNRESSCSLSQALLLACLGVLVITPLVGCPESNPDLGGFAPLNNGNSQAGGNQTEAALRPGEIDMDDGAPIGLPDGTYTTGDVTVAFRDGAGRSAIVAREALFDWATKAGLVTRAQISSLGDLGGVQTLTLGGRRFLVDVYIEGSPAKLWATLQELRFDGETASIFAEIQFELIPGDGSGLGGRVASLRLTWEGIAVVERVLTTTSGSLAWTTPAGVSGGETRDGETWLFMGDTGQLDAVAGLWVFETLLSASENAKWDKDTTSAYFGFQFGAGGEGVGVRAINREREGIWHPLFGIGFGTIEGGERTLEAYPDAFVSIPVGESRSVCPDGPQCQVTLANLDITENAIELTGRMEAIYEYVKHSGGFFGSSERTGRMQRAVFEFGGGIARLRSSPLVSEEHQSEGTPWADFPIVPDLQRYELVFSRLDLHSQVLLDTNEELDGVGDPEASISLIGARVNDIPVRIDGTWNRSATYGDLVRLTTRVDGEPPAGIQYYWVGAANYSQPPFLPAGTNVAGPALDFPIPETWRDSAAAKDALRRGEPLAYIVFVFAYDNTANLVGFDAVQLEIQ